MHVDASPAQWAARSAAGLDDRAELLGQDAELRVEAAHREASVRLGQNLGIDADEHVDLGPATGCTGKRCRILGRFE